MLAITLGGVHINQVLEAFTVLFAYMLFGYGIAMFSSVVCSRNSTAARATTGFLGFYFFAPPLTAVAMLVDCDSAYTKQP